MPSIRCASAFFYLQETVMQELLPNIKTALMEWAQLTFANPLYAAFLVLATALLAAIFGMVKSMPLKKRAAASEKECVELSNQLSLARAQAAGLQERLAQRNQQVSATVQALAAGFDLNEQPVAAAGEDLVSEDLWQQHDRIITGLADRLRAEQQAKAELQQSFQAEIGKRVEKEALIDNLQTTLAEKTLQINGLEQQAAEILEKHAAQSARLAELEQQALAWRDAENRLEQMEERLAAKDAELSQLQTQVAAINKAEFILPQAPAEPVAVAEPLQPPIHEEPIEAAVPLQPQILQEPEPIRPQTQAETGQAAEVSPPADVVEAVAVQDAPQSIVLPEWDYQPEAAAVSQAEAPPARASASGVAGKFKSLFGKPRQSAAAKEAEEEKSAGPVQTAVQADASNEGVRKAAGPGQLDKIKNLLGMSRPAAPAEEAKPAVAQGVEEAVRSEPAETGGISAGSAQNSLQKIKNLFGTAK
jgi:hypothetical protein